MVAKNIADKVEELYNRKVAFCARVGSYNYGLETETSSINYKVFVLPSFNDLYSNNMLSKTFTSDKLNYTVYDIRKLIDSWWKSNINFIEPLFSNDYYVGVEEFEEFLINRERIAKMNLPYLYKSCSNMYYSKINRLHEYTENNAYMEKEYGYNLKEACNATRIMKVVLDLVDNDLRFIDAINYDYRPLVKSLFLDIKKGAFSEKSWELMIKPIRERFMEDEFINKIKSHTSDVLFKTKIDNCIKDIVKNNLKLE